MDEDTTAAMTTTRLTTTMFAIVLAVCGAAHAATPSHAVANAAADGAVGKGVAFPGGHAAAAGASNSGVLARRGASPVALKRRRSRQRRCQSHPEITGEWHTRNEGRMRCNIGCDGA